MLALDEHVRPLSSLTCDRRRPLHYRDDRTGEAFWSISQVLTLLYDQVPAASPALDAAQTRGTDVHAICALLLAASVARGAPPVIPDAYAGYAASYAAWMARATPTPLLIETPAVCADRYRPYAGTPDALVLAAGKRTLVELKTGAPQPWHAVQVQAQWHLVGYERATQARLLYLDADGRLPKIVVVRRDPRAWAAFCAALTVLQYRLGHAGGPHDVPH